MPKFAKISMRLRGSLQGGGGGDVKEVTFISASVLNATYRKKCSDSFFSF